MLVRRPWNGSATIGSNHLINTLTCRYSVYIQCLRLFVRFFPSVKTTNLSLCNELVLVASCTHNLMLCSKEQGNLKWHGCSNGRMLRSRTRPHTIRSYTFWYLMNSQPWLFLPWIMQIQRRAETVWTYFCDVNLFSTLTTPWSGMDAESVCFILCFLPFLSWYLSWLTLAETKSWLSLFLCASAARSPSSCSGFKCICPEAVLYRQWWHHKQFWDETRFIHSNLVSVSICRIEKRVMWIRDRLMLMATCPRLWLGCHIHRGSVLRVFLGIISPGNIATFTTKRDLEWSCFLSRTMRTEWDSWKHPGVAFISGHPSSECSGLLSWPHTSNIDMQRIWLTPTENSMPDWNVYRTMLMNLSAKNSDWHPWALHAEKLDMADNYMQIKLRDNRTHCDRTSVRPALAASSSPRISFNSSGLEPWWMWPDAQQACGLGVFRNRSTDYSERFLTDGEQIYANLKSLTNQNNGHSNWWSWQFNAGDLCFQNCWLPRCARHCPLPSWHWPRLQPIRRCQDMAMANALVFIHHCPSQGELHWQALMADAVHGLGDTAAEVAWVLSLRLEVPHTWRVTWASPHCAWYCLLLRVHWISCCALHFVRWVQCMTISCECCPGDSFGVCWSCTTTRQGGNEVMQAILQCLAKLPDWHELHESRWQIADFQEHPWGHGKIESIGAVVVSSMHFKYDGVEGWAVLGVRLFICLLFVWLIVWWLGLRVYADGLCHWLIELMASTQVTCILLYIAFSMGVGLGVCTAIIQLHWQHLHAVNQKECAQIVEAMTASPLWCLCSQMPSKEEDAAVSSYCATHLVPKLHNILVPVFYWICYLLPLSCLILPRQYWRLCDSTEEVIDGATSRSKDLTCSIPMWKASI